MQTKKIHQLITKNVAYTRMNILKKKESVIVNNKIMNMKLRIDYTMFLNKKTKYQINKNSS